MFQSNLSRGIALLALAAILLAVSYVVMRIEEAQWSGIEDLGPPFIPMMFGIPILISALLGLGFLIELVFRRIRGPRLPD
jgi:hypothetical protein